MALRSRVRDDAHLGLCQRRHWRNRWRRRGARQFGSQLLRERLRCRPREVADDRHHRLVGSVVTAVKRNQVITRNARHGCRLAGTAQAVRMITIREFAEIPAGHGFRLGIRLPDGVDDAFFLALEHRCRKLRALQHARQDIQRLLHFIGAGKRAQRHAGTIAVHPAAELRAGVRHAPRNLVFRQAAGAELEQALRERCNTRFFARVVCRAGRKIHAYIEHRQVARLDKVDARAVFGLPVLYRQQRPCRCRYRAQRDYAKPALHVIEHDALPPAPPAWQRPAAADREPRP